MSTLRGLSEEDGTVLVCHGRSLGSAVQAPLQGSSCRSWSPDAQEPPAQGRCPRRADRPTERASYPGAPGGSAPFPPGPVSSDPAAARQGGTGRPEPLPDGKTQTSCLCGALGSLKTLPLPPLAQPLLLSLRSLWFHCDEERRGAPPSPPAPAATAATSSKATGLTQL